MIDLSSKINIIYFANTIKLGFYARKINIDIEKIDKSYLDIFEIVIIDCFVKNKQKRLWFF